MFRRKEFSLPHQLVGCRALFDACDFEQVLKMVAEARTRLDEYYARRPRHRRRAEAVCAAYAGRALISLDRFEEALPQLILAERELIATDPKDGPDPDLVWTLRGLSIISLEEDRFEDCLIYCDRVLALVDAPAPHMHRLFTQHRVGSLVDRMQCEVQLGRLPDAGATADSAYAAASAHPRDDYLFGECQTHRAPILLMLGRVEDAEQAAADALDLLTEFTSPMVADLVFRAADAYSHATMFQGRPGDAIERLELAAAAIRRSHEDDPQAEILIATLLYLGNALNEIGEPGRALAPIEEAEDLLRGQDNDRLHAFHLATRAEQRWRSGRVAEALVDIDACVTLCDQEYAPDEQPPFYLEDVKAARLRLATA